MTAPKDLKSNFSTLEDRIQKLIYLCEDLKKDNQRLLAEKRQMTVELEEEKERTKRLEEGYKT